MNLIVCRRRRQGCKILKFIISILIPLNWMDGGEWKEVSDKGMVGEWRLKSWIKKYLI